MSWNRTFTSPSVSEIENSSITYLLNVLENEKQNILNLAPNGSTAIIKIESIKIEGKLLIKINYTVSNVPDHPTIVII